MNPSILKSSDLLQAEEYSGGQSGTALILRSSIAGREPKIVRLLTGNAAGGNPGDPQMARLVRTSQTTPNQLRLYLQTMLAKTESLDPSRTPKNMLQPFWFDKVVRMQGGAQTGNANILKKQRIAVASWITKAIQMQPAALYIAASNEGSGELPNGIRQCGGRLLGFAHTVYDSAMFFEPFVEGEHREKGLLPLGFQAYGGVFMEVPRPMLEETENNRP